jgi:predicted oxidoreductase
MTIYSTTTFLFFTLYSLLFPCLLHGISVVPQIKLCAYSDCPSVSRIGMGTLHLGDSIEGLTDVNDIKAWIEEAYSLGITLFDLADVYPVKGGDAGTSASLFGQALAMTGLRNQVTLVAKMDIIFPSTIDTSREHLQSVLDWYLSVLMTDYVDILILHYSNSFMNATEVGQFFIDTKAAGKAKHFGVSNHYPSKFDLLQSKLDEMSKGNIKLVTHEFEASVWNPSSMNYNNAIADHAYQLQIHPLAWGPLAGDPIGGLNRLFVRVGDRQRKILNALGDVGAEIGISDESLVALIWLLEHPVGFIPLLGTTKTARLRSQVTAFNHLGKMTVEQWWAIAGKGGLCALGDSQCNYSEYMAK